MVPQTETQKNLPFAAVGIQPTQAAAATATAAATTRAAAAAAAAGSAASALDEPRTPRRVPHRKPQNGGDSGASRPAEGEAPSGQGAPGAPGEKEEMVSLWHSEESPLRSPYKKQADERQKLLVSCVVFSNMHDLLKASTNGYLRFLQGRCNAVRLPVLDDLFL